MQRNSNDIKQRKTTENIGFVEKLAYISNCSLPGYLFSLFKIGFLVKRDLQISKILLAVFKGSYCKTWCVQGGKMAILRILSCQPFAKQY